MLNGSVLPVLSEEGGGERERETERKRKRDRERKREREICEHVVKDKAQSSCTDCHQLHTVRAEAKSEDTDVSTRAIFFVSGWGAGDVYLLHSSITHVVCKECFSLFV